MSKFTDVMVCILDYLQLQESKCPVIYSMLSDRWYQEGTLSDHYEKYKDVIKLIKQTVNNYNK